VGAAVALAVVLAFAGPASARKYQMSGTWLMRRGQLFLPLQFAATGGGSQMTHLSMGLFTEAPFSPPGQVVSDVGGVTAAGASPATLRIPRHRFVREHRVTIPLDGSMLVQITTRIGIDAPRATASLMAGAGPGSLTWCPSNPACTAGGLPPGGIGNNGRVVYVPGTHQFGGTMQMGLRGGGNLAVKGAGLPAGVVAHARFAGSGNALRSLALGGPQAGPDTPATEFVKLAPGLLTAPAIFPASGQLILYPGPVVGMFPSISTPMGAMTGQFTTHWGFGHTTGTVIVQQASGSSGDDLFTVMGSDARTPLGAGNLSLVAGGIARRNTLAGDSVYAQFDRVSMSLGPPVPSLSPAGLAAAAALLLLAVAYALRRRLQ
jgi:hypothetical protein